MKHLSLIIPLMAILSGCCIFGSGKNTNQQCNFEKSVCENNIQAFKNEIEQFHAKGGMYIVLNVTQNKIVEKTSINFDEDTKIWAYNPLRLFYLTAGLNSGVFSKKNIIFNTNAPNDFKKVAEDDKNRVFANLGVDDFNTPQQLLAGYLNVFDNKDNLLTKTQLSLLKFAVAENVKSGAAKRANIADANVSGLTATSDYKLKEGQVITLFVGTFTAHGEDYALVTVLDNPQGIKETYGYDSAGWNIVPTAKNIIENIVK